MTNKRAFKKTGFFFSLLIIIAICFGLYNYYQNIDKHNANTNKYPKYIGYINPQSALIVHEDKLCNDEKIYGTHHGFPEFAFKISKKHFRENILTKYKNKNYNDSGYLNLRFLINCNGVADWFEIIEMNLDLEEVNLNEAMVNQLLKLTSNYESWSKLTSRNGEPIDYYMYISYRIENGEIIEILP